ncbi:MAG: hypothetical protein ACE5PV_11670 [Candidatus Poribacteria bacterium]
MYAKRIMSVALACFIFISVYIPIALAKEEIKVTNIEVGSGKPYKVGEGGLEVGTVYYIDRQYVVTAMPEELEGATWIMTANDDKHSKGEDFLKFTVNRPVAVWMAHDSRGEEEKGGTPPGWLSKDNGWERHPDMTITVTDANMGDFILWSKEFEKGEIVLGGNEDAPAAGHGSNYIVLLTPSKGKAVEPQNKLPTVWGNLKSLY